MSITATVEVPTVLTTDDVAARWGMSREWVQQQAADGRIPGAFRAGRRWRFRTDLLIAHEEAQATPLTNVFALAPGAAARRRKSA